jgi:hypothetical protein
MHRLATKARTMCSEYILEKTRVVLPHMLPSDLAGCDSLEKALVNSQPQSESFELKYFSSMYLKPEMNSSEF